METRLLPPIRSVRDGEPDLEPEIDAFVFGLGELVDSLQDAEAAGDIGRVQRVAQGLQSQGDSLGYPLVSAAAAQILSASLERSTEALHKSIVDLTEFSQRVRRGHRSAAV